MWSASAARHHIWQPTRRSPWACACMPRLLGALPQHVSYPGRRLLTTRAGPCGPHAALDMPNCGSCPTTCQHSIGVSKDKNTQGEAACPLTPCFVKAPAITRRHHHQALHTCQHQGSMQAATVTRRSLGHLQQPSPFSPQYPST